MFEGKSISEIQQILQESGFRNMDSAPKDGTAIVAYCADEADPKDGINLTTYGAHAEGLGHVPDGFHVLVWGGAYHEGDLETGTSFTIPDWWFRDGSNFEEVAAPLAWKPIV